MIRTRLVVLAAVLTGCRAGTAPAPVPVPLERATLAQIYYWRAKPGKLEEYSRYITQSAERVDAEAQREGAFISVTTYLSRDSTSAWTHMRVFLLRDSLQLQDLSAALSRAGVRLEPDSVKRRMRSQYSATLRDPAGSATVEILR